MIFSLVILVGTSLSDMCVVTKAIFMLEEHNTINASAPFDKDSKGLAYSQRCACVLLKKLDDAHKEEEV